MSLWTPSGEHPVDHDRLAQAQGPAPQGPGAPSDAELDESAAAVEELRRQLADAPAEVVVANHCYGLFELAAVYLSQTPPALDRARLAIDALGAVVEGLGDRLGESFPPLSDALAQVRLAYVQLQQADDAMRESQGNGAAAPGA